MGDMGGTEAPVPFDFAAADRLMATCNAAASSVDNHASSCGAIVRTASEDFVGVFADLFQDNARIAMNDARELAHALREMARQTLQLKKDAEAEEQRRREAREWYAHEATKRDQVEDGILKVATLGLRHDRPPDGPGNPPPAKPVPPPTPTPRSTPSSGRPRLAAASPAAGWAAT